MKKLLAMTGTAALGTMGMLVIATPAHAAPAEPACQTIDDHQLNFDATPDSDWYMSCVPLYGESAKAEADVTFISANGFPAGFDPNSATITTDFDDGPAGTYMHESVTHGFSSPFTLESSTQDEQTYQAGVVLQIAGVSKIDPSALPSDCGGTYNAAFRVDYVPRTVTFSQKIGGTTYAFQGTIGSDPMLLGMNLTDTHGPLEDDAAFCAAVGSAVHYESDNAGVLPSAATSLGPSDLDRAADVGPVVRLHTVTFDSQGGSATQPEDVREGSPATSPTAPSRQGYTFGGWFTEPTGGTQWNFGSPIPSDMTLYAHWKVNSYTVTFDSQQGSAVDSATVAYDASVPKPADPTRDGYAFDGWYTESTAGALWNFASAITANTTLYAHWKAVSPELAESGSDLAAWPALGLGMLAVGAAAAALSFARRRRGEH